MFTGATVQAQTAPDAKPIIEKTGAFARSLKTVYGDFISTTTDRNGPHPVHTQVWAETPDKMARRFTSPKGSTTFYVNAARTTIYTQSTNKYMSTPRVDPTITNDLMQVLEAGLGPVSPGQPDNRQITLVGSETVAGIPCKHIRMVEAQTGTADVWIADGAQPLPVYMRSVGAGTGDINESLMRWIVNKPIPPETFQFVPPPGATGRDSTAGAAGN